MLTLNWVGGGLAHISHAVGEISTSKGRTALRRAVNHTGDKTFTQVKRALSEQVGLPQHKIIERGAIRRYRANYQTLDYAISARGSHLSLKEFGPRQFKAGTRAKPWGRLEMFEHAFMGPRPGVIAGRLRGHVFARRTKRRLPIRMLWGPSIPREMVRAETAIAFQATVSAGLPDRIEHELRVLTKGVVT